MAGLVGVDDPVQEISQNADLGSLTGGGTAKDEEVERFKKEKLEEDGSNQEASEDDVDDNADLGALTGGTTPTEEEEQKSNAEVLRSKQESLEKLDNFRQIDDNSDLGAFTGGITTEEEKEEEQRSNTEVPRSKQECLEKVDNFRQIDGKDGTAALTGGTTTVGGSEKKRTVDKGKGKLEDDSEANRKFMKTLVVECGQKIANVLDHCMGFGLEDHKLVALLLELKEGFQSDTPIGPLVTSKVDELLQPPARVKKAEKYWEDVGARANYVYGNSEESQIFTSLHKQAKVLEAAIKSDKVSDLELAYENHDSNMQPILKRIDAILDKNDPPKLETMTRLDDEKEKRVEEAEGNTKGMVAIGAGVIAAIITFMFCLHKTWKK